MGPTGIFGSWILQGFSAIGHCRDILQLVTTGILDIAGIFCSWALQGYFVAGHYRDIGHCRDILQLDITRIFCGWTHPLRFAAIFIAWA